MNNGLKSGSADDPWGDGEANNEEESTVPAGDRETSSDNGGRENPREDSRLSRANISGGSTSSSRRPYIDRRDGAKDERQLVQFFLREEIYGDMTESRVRLAAGEELGEEPGKFDLREALVAVGTEHVDEVVEELREMGY